MKILHKNSRKLFLKNESKKQKSSVKTNSEIVPEILFITSFPPRECGIATYSNDLIFALKKKFSPSFKLIIGALENHSEKPIYFDKPAFVLNTDEAISYEQIAVKINENQFIEMVVFQHEFGFFTKMEKHFIHLLQMINKPIIISFHTVLPHPQDFLKSHIQEIGNLVNSILVMTKTSAKILMEDYGISKEKITVIPHGTHLTKNSDKKLLKEKYHLKDKKVLSTFGFLSSGKSIETTLDALPKLVDKNPNLLFLIIGKTHPSVIKNEGEAYREMLKEKIQQLHLENHVRFINQYLPLEELLEYLQLTDIYLFTSKDRNQAVSGTFSYAVSCGCPIISTPIPHAKEVLKNDAGILIDFENSEQLGKAVSQLLKSKKKREELIANGLHRIAPTAWENSAIHHAKIFEKIGEGTIQLQYNLPEINLAHIKRMTTSFGMIQFSKINKPDIESGFTLDDNARALIALCQYFQINQDEKHIELIEIYFDFIKYCLQSDGTFLNYVDESKNFTKQNNTTNLEDSNGRAIWALGFLISNKKILSTHLIKEAEMVLEKALENVLDIHSTRAMAFIIKGIYFQNKAENKNLIINFADRLVNMYRHENKQNWHWFESYLTYGNSLLPEAMLCAFLMTKNVTYKEIAIESFDFLLSKIFKNNEIHVVSNQGWLQQNENDKTTIGGEQPIDVAYTILALQHFYEVFNNALYLEKMNIAFHWFLGKNHLFQIIYNPATGGCYDGLEEDYVNLNQGAESTVSYLMARLVFEKIHE